MSLANSSENPLRRNSLSKKNSINNRRTKKHILSNHFTNLITQKVKIIDPFSFLLLNKDYFYILNEDISKYSLSMPRDTSSGALVIKIEGKPESIFKNMCFVIKYTPIGTNELLIQSSINECVIYIYLQYLIKYDITPFLYYGYYWTNYVNENKFLHVKNKLKINTPNVSKNGKNNASSKKILSEFNTNINILFLESDICDTETKNFDKYITDNIKSHDLVFNIQIILFHVFYTLKILSRLGIKHNDLHLGNVLIISDDIRDSNNKYIIFDNGIDVKEYLIPNIGITTRIIDFDLSSKSEPENKAKLIQELQNLEDSKSYQFKNINYMIKTFLNNDNDVRYDVFKILYKLKNKNIDLIESSDIIKLINSFNNTNNLYSLMIEADDEKLDHISNKIDNFGNVNKFNLDDLDDTPGFNILPINNIIENLYIEITKNLNAVLPLKNTYSMLNMYKKTKKNN